MSDALNALIEKARAYQMTPEELAEQRISFAYGNTNYEDKRVTREVVVHSAELLCRDSKCRVRATW